MLCIMDHHPPDTKRTKREEQLEEGSVIAPLDARLSTCLHGGLRKLLLHSKSSPSILGQTLNVFAPRVKEPLTSPSHEI
jgi:hypothetical protein